MKGFSLPIYFVFVALASMSLNIFGLFESECWVAGCDSVILTPHIEATCGHCLVLYRCPFMLNSSMLQTGFLSSVTTVRILTEMYVWQALCSELRSLLHLHRAGRLTMPREFWQLKKLQEASLCACEICECVSVCMYMYDGKCVCVSMCMWAVCQCVSVYRCVGMWVCVCEYINAWERLVC